MRAVATVVNGITTILALIAVFRLNMMGATFWVSVILLGYVIAFWRAAKKRWPAAKARHHAVGFIVSAIAWAIASFGGMIFNNVELFGTSSTSILLISAIVFGLYGTYEELVTHLGGASHHRLAVGTIVAIIGAVMIFYGVFHGSWANAGELVGGAGYGVEEAAQNVANVAGTGWEAFAASLSPSNNPNIARIQCTFEAGLGGGMNPQQGAGSVAIQACVREKLGQNRSTAESEQVTEPVEVQVEEVQVEPFPDHLRVVLPVTNTLVYDLQGRTINITAQDVNVTARIKYLGSQVAKASREGMRIPNGDTRTIEFNRLEGGGDGEFVFPLFSYVTDNFQPASTIQRNFETIKSDCNNDGWGDESSSCKSAVTYFLSGDSPSNFEFRSDRFTRERIAFLAKATDNFEMDGLHYVKDYGIAELNSENLIAAGNQYEIEVDASYTYSAEAAFTESSRWRSGNLLLKVWNPDAWNELSFDERQSWESENCGTVERFNQEFTKQRTAALTTPIVPVMYTDCSSTLFRLIDDENDDGTYDGDIEISVGASVKGDSVDQDHPIEINGASTTCGNDGSNDLTDSNDVQKAVPEKLTHQAGAGWAVDPGIVTRSVEVAGESLNIGCNVEMTFRLTVDRTTTYEVPAFDYEQ
jgi:hypothetical protein